MQEYNDIIVPEPGKRNGRPSIRNTRIAILDVLSYLAAGMTVEEMLIDFCNLPARITWLVWNVLLIWKKRLVEVDSGMG